ncbi:recombinase family protein [Paenibacillus dokdonensis]|uniref:Recombinase family protein n=1 Tax=Paenibacillus dokdonensis TaxID=2567944 RepID=A0ABU6GTT8_9BACL|nr:recombinase family protein [Paenibacillus dokdonensis]MEC0242789.1 recombinase family protein [Paenibacillus dokdonensis]
MKAAIYTRVSTDEQAQKGNSLTEQNERLRAYCKAMGYDEVDLYEDDGFSAKDMNRPKLKQLLDKVADYDLVVTTKIDRLCRNLLDLLTVIDFLEINNCGYASASESFDTSTPAGRMVLQILGAFAEFERERIRERVRDNMRSLAKNTTKAIGRPCFGFDIVNGEFEINEHEADYVHKMAEWIIHGSGCLKVAKLLNDKGVRTKDGNTFSEGAVRKLMRRETLMGTLVYNRTYTHKGKQLTRPEDEWIIVENHHPAILDSETFQNVQNAITGRKSARKQADNERWLLSGLVVCEHCGSSMTGQHRKKPSGREYFNYICSKYHKKGECFRHYVDRDDLENGIINDILLTDTFNFGKANTTKSDVTPGYDIKSIKDQLNKCSNKLQKQLELYEEGELSKEDFINAKNRIEKERYLLNKQLIEATAESDEVLNSKMKLKVESFKDQLLSKERLVVKNAIRQIVDQIRITDGTSVSIVYMPI